MQASGQQYKSLRGGPSSRPPMGMIGRIVSIVLGAVLIAGALLFSVLLFIALLAIVIVAGGYVWWKTRALRRQMREQMQQAMQQAHRPGADGPVIEGEFVRERHDADSKP